MDVSQFEPCARPDKGSGCVVHGGWCHDEDLLFHPGPPVFFDWGKALRPTDRLFFTFDSNDALADDESFGGVIIPEDTNDDGITVSYQTTTVHAEVELWVRYYSEILERPAPSVEGFLPDDHRCPESTTHAYVGVFLGTVNNLLGIYSCSACSWSERGILTSDFSYAMQQPWPTDVNAVVRPAGLGGPSAQFICDAAGWSCMSVGETVEDAEFGAFREYLSKISDVG